MYEIPPRKVRGAGVGNDDRTGSPHPGMAADGGLVARDARLDLRLYMCESAEQQSKVQRVLFWDFVRADVRACCRPLREPQWRPQTCNCTSRAQLRSLRGIDKAACRQMLHRISSGVAAAHQNQHERPRARDRPRQWAGAWREEALGPPSSPASRCQMCGGVQQPSRGCAPSTSGAEPARRADRNCTLTPADGLLARFKIALWRPFLQTARRDGAAG